MPLGAPRRLGLGWLPRLGSGWLFLGFGVDFGWLSVGFRLDSGFGLILGRFWLGLIWIWLDFDWIWFDSEWISKLLGGPRRSWEVLGGPRCTRKDQTLILTMVLKATLEFLGSY